MTCWANPATLGTAAIPCTLISAPCPFVPICTAIQPIVQRAPPCSYHYLKASYANVGCCLLKSKTIKAQLLLELKNAVSASCYYRGECKRRRGRSSVVISPPSAEFLISTSKTIHIHSAAPFFLPRAPPPFKNKKAANAILVSQKATRPQNLLFCHVYSSPNGETSYTIS